MTKIPYLSNLSLFYHFFFFFFSFSLGFFLFSFFFFVHFLSVFFFILFFLFLFSRGEVSSMHTPAPIYLHSSTSTSWFETNITLNIFFNKLIFIPSINVSLSFHTSLLLFSFIHHKLSAFLHLFSFIILSFLFPLSLVSLHLHHHSNPLFALRLFPLHTISNHYTYFYPHNFVINIHFIRITLINFILIFIIIIFFTSRFKINLFLLGFLNQLKGKIFEAGNQKERCYRKEL